MDTGSLFSARQAAAQVLRPPFFSKGRAELSARGAPSPLGALSRARGVPFRGLGQDLGLQVDERFRSAVYQSLVQKTTLVAQFREAAARAPSLGGKGRVSSPEAEGVDGQLRFDFFAEVRMEALALFGERTRAVAEGLDGVGRETFIEVSRRVAVRFELSVSVSGTVLTGFAGAAEGLDGGAAMDRLIALTDELLARTNDILNEAFALLEGFFGGEGDLGSRMEDLFAALSGLSVAGAAPGERLGLEGAVGVQLEFKFSFSIEIEVGETQVQESDPITLDLDGDGIELTSYRGGARFDIEGTGRQVTTAFVTGGDAFLAIDRNGNGVVDSGRELFGDQNGAVNGFEELRKLDSNGDGVINAQDRDFELLRVFRDDGDGKTEAGELITLAEAGVEEISLGYRETNDGAAGGNRIAQVASFLRTDGSRGAAVDAVLSFTV